ncbi:DUF4826 family protein [Pseudidiomarina salilacus]|uniref:DUF4826 family protein n=1 Tax=Pseudidiomarina salilacus TaxID=3384452 RepID=UPI0039847BE7
MAIQLPPMSQEETSKWVREQFQAANKFLAENGIISDRVLTKDSRYLAPYVAVWKFTTQDRKELWLVNGDVPTDVTGKKAADNARDALRYFSFQWQLKAQNLMADEQAMADPTKRQYANYLVNRAETIYEVVDSPDLWEAPAEDQSNG